LKSGSGTEICALPSGPTATTPEWKATSVSVGVGPSKRAMLASPPERTMPRTPCMRSISWP
jgi:hypothetical protein